MSIEKIMVELDWRDISDHYYERHDVHTHLLSLFKARNVVDFSDLLVGIGNGHGNYSASDHELGPKILEENVNSRKRLYDVSEKFMELKNSNTVPKLIRDAGLKYFQIGVGSEASCMLNPAVCWVTNTKTVWAHLLFKHNGNASLANEELRLYRNGEENSDMAYSKWRAIHKEMGASSDVLIKYSVKYTKTNVENMNYLWADSISNALYELNR
ncbi:hypothetical protein [Acetobacter sp. LMG 32666]|uniref:hypothetical protein n=1 Tax=Acetobacter sp. LMG 32666 TaxID=2959295 RepID=UPI0030C802A4